MPRSSARRGQTELAALVAVLAVCLGLGLYADAAVDASVPDRSPPTPGQVADRAADHARVGGALVPDRLARARAAAPTGRRLNVSLAAAGQRWSVGPVPAGDVETARLRVSVRLDGGRVRPGWLRVAVWR